MVQILRQVRSLVDAVVKMIFDLILPDDLWDFPLTASPPSLEEVLNRALDPTS